MSALGILEVFVGFCLYIRQAVIWIYTVFGKSHLTLWFIFAAMVPERNVGPRLSVIAANLKIIIIYLW